MPTPIESSARPMYFSVPKGNNIVMQDMIGDIAHASAIPEQKRIARTTKKNAASFLIYVLRPYPRVQRVCKKNANMMTFFFPSLPIFLPIIGPIII